MSVDSDQEIAHPSRSTPSPEVEEAPESSRDNDRSLSWYAAREPLVVLVLSAIAVLFFFVVGEFSNLYRNELKQRGSMWFSRGVNDLHAARVQSAVTDFQVALSYSRDNYGYELSLAQALVSLQRTEEARAYLINLWQREPENGPVNLELARIYAEKHDITRALRYYHNAIYAVWDTDGEAHQLSVRLELIRFLIEHTSFNQAESELIAVGRDLPDHPALHLEIADFFMKVSDHQRALQQYREVVKLERHNAAALAGAGRAALQLAQFSLAERYLTEALVSNPGDEQSAELLKVVKAIPTLDPYETLAPVRRIRAAISAFNIAGDRLKQCLSASSADASSDSPLQTLYSHWTDMRTTATERTLRQHPEQLDSIMDAAFSIEKQTSEVCGTPSGPDLALLLLARRHEGSSRE